MAGMNPLTMSLFNARQRRGRTQVEVAERMASTQSAVSRFEKQGDALVSSLMAWVEATGGTLRLVASYGDEEIDLFLNGEDL